MSGLTHWRRRCLLLLLVGSAAGCAALSGSAVQQAPSIAHAHLGHALVAAQNTPEQAGYLLLAERRAAQSSQLARKAASGGSAATVNAVVAELLEVLDSRSSFGLKQCVIQASEHVRLAAESADASSNLRANGPAFLPSIQKVLERTELIKLLSEDLIRSTLRNERRLLANKLVELTLHNQAGSDNDADSRTGATLDEYGLKQLRLQLDRLQAGEGPDYVPLDRNRVLALVQQPDGRWAFDEALLAAESTAAPSRGYDPGGQRAPRRAAARRNKAEAARPSNTQ